MAQGVAPSERAVLIGGASAFWGDSALGAQQLVAHPGLQYLVFDYLAELTMSILVGARLKQPQLGYATDFVEIAMRAHLAQCLERGIRVVANAGGVNPQACGERLAELAASLGISVRIAVVDGDDVLPLTAELRAAGTTDFYGGAAMPARLISANAYLGAVPIARALAMGAQVVVTGRVVDSALTLGPLMHEFGWREDDYDRLAAGSLAGHLIECGAQATGGLFTDWQSVPNWADIGYPVIECHASGEMVLTKPAGTGGIVRAAALAEQLVYEIDNPAAYLLPDVACDFTQVTMEGLSEARVLVRGARGSAPTPTYKVSATYQDGFRCVASLTLAGFAAGAKARRSGEAILERTRRFLQERGAADFAGTEIDVFGPTDEQDFGEAVVRIATSHTEKAALELFAREVASAGTSFAPGTTGSLNSGRPSVSPRIRLFTFLIEKSRVAARVRCGEHSEVIEASPGVAAAPAKLPASDHTPSPLGPSSSGRQAVEVPLLAIAHGRSGDKGDRCNIGLIARAPEFVEVIRRQVTAEVVRAHLARWVEGKVTRYEMPGIGGFNFVLEQALGGGGMASLRADPLGKAMAQRLLALKIRVDPSMV
jgi:hypothetical protein